jgi:hypothetical protein
LRQGDPLSLFLFILGSEILSKLILGEENLESLHGIKMASTSPPISHLLFADDVMIFSQANGNEANAIINCLSTYARWSGQCINMSKSAVFFSKNCRPATRNAVKSILHLQSIPARAKYLGIPLFMLSKERDTFIELNDRIFAKISG